MRKKRKASWPSGGSAAGAWRTAWKRRRERLFTFLRYPPQQWKSLRTTNALERLHGEFKRRVKTQCAATQRGNGGHAVLPALMHRLGARSPCAASVAGKHSTKSPVKKPVTLAAWARATIVIGSYGQKPISTTIGHDPSGSRMATDVAAQ